MKAAQIEKYTKEIQIKINNVDKSEVKANEVLIKVKAAGVNPVDLLISTGGVKLISDYQFPLTLGNEFSGIIEEVGTNVTGFEVGDRIYTRLPIEKIGAFAEYVTVDVNAIAKMPEHLSFVDAASIPLTALTAYQALNEILEAKEGEKIFIPGGTGGFGAMAIPIAKSMGLFVATSGSERGRERMIALGVDKFINYHEEAYTDSLSDFDYVIDTLGVGEFEKELGILKSGGKLVSLKGLPNYRFAKRNNFPMWKCLLFGLVGRKLDKLASKQNKEYHFMFVKESGKQLKEITKLIENENIKVSIDSIYPFDQIEEALRKVATGHSEGKVVISFE